MYIYQPHLSTINQKNSTISKYSSKGFILRNYRMSIMEFNKKDSASTLYYNVSDSKPIGNYANYRSIGKCHTYLSDKLEPCDIKTNKLYLDEIIKNYNATTLYMILTIFILIMISSYVPSSLSGIIGITVGILLSISVVRSVSSRRFKNKVYQPFLKENKFLDDKLKHRYLVSTLTPFEMRFLDKSPVIYKSEKLKKSGQYFNYIIESLHNRNEVETTLNNLGYKSINVSLIVKD